MPLCEPFRAWSLMWIVAIWMMPAPGWACEIIPSNPDLVPPTSSASVQSADEALDRALDLERRREWSAAIQVYEAALERWPGRVDLRHRLRLCESHYRLGKRYQDRSFREVLLRLPTEQCFDLLDEILERIQADYVDPVSPIPLIRYGYDNLEVALRDPVFLGVHAPRSDPERIRRLRNALTARRQSLAIRTREDARREVQAACDLARGAAGISPPGVILEFAYGACDRLDDYSNYLTPDRLDDLYAMIDGNFVGLGVELKQDDLGLLLVGVLKGGPAWESKLAVGDRITHVDGTSVKGLDLDAAANRLQGPEGSSVTITVLRGQESRNLTLARRPVEVQSVAESRMVDPASGIGYVQLIGFQKTSTEELRSALNSLSRQGMRHLIIDLRGNPGGLLNVAVEIADLFLDDGVIVSTRGRASGQSMIYRARRDGGWAVPMTVLIDHDSASASEILAGALKDHGRATVVGERSYGKGSVQSIFPLRAAPAGLKLTTAKFYSPLDRPYSEQGVEPDAVVTVRARPTAGRELPPTTLGDPESDPVLRAAIQQARGTYRAAG